MPLDTYARRLAVEVTGREKWGSGRGPAAYSGRHPMQFLADLLFKGRGMLHEPLIGVDNRPFKELVGLDPARRFFSATEIAASKGVNDLLAKHDEARRLDPQASANRDQRRAIDLFSAGNRIAALATDGRLPIVPGEPGKAFRLAGPTGGDPGTGSVSSALAAFGRAYAAGEPLDAHAASVRAAIDALGVPTPADARSVALESFYNRHAPWRWTQVLFGLAIVLFGLSRLFWRRAMLALALTATAAGTLEYVLGMALRTAIVQRAPVSNTFEVLLWMGLVAIVIGLLAQLLVDRKSYYLFGSVVAAFACVLFAGMVPLTDRTNSLPAVLRSNYWLIIHVITIVSSYGVLAVAGVLGHVYLTRNVLLARGTRPPTPPEPGPHRSPPLIVQTYRCIQIGLLLLTAGTILGGVWAADSWGRFWGWDPKETWALISIVVYFAILHARYSRWIMDFGLAASAILGFIVIVWTFYGVNYVMASGLHSYGFGSGGEVWVGLWAAIELAFLVLCRVRFVAMRKRGSAPPSTAAA